MIIVQLTGGLGNQLFQYAMGRALAVKNNCELKLDLSFFLSYEWHEYSLEPFNLEMNYATKAEVENLKSLDLKLYNRIKRKLFGGKKYVIYEEDLLFNFTYKLVGPPAYLMGYWQCEKYFEDYREVIKEEFKIVREPSEANLEILTKIKNTESISLHIRRGNFVSVDFVNRVHGTCSMEYYAEAIVMIVAKCENPVFYIFSDDINWAKENLKIKYENIFIDINDAKTDYEDLRLMSGCKHNILANSTFSWWGAWLNLNPDKIVITPKHWFADSEKNKLSKTIVPDSWIRI